MPSSDVANAPDHTGRESLDGLFQVRVRACPGRRQLALAFTPDPFIETGHPVRRRDMADRAVLTHRVVVLDVLDHQPASILQAQWGLDSNTFPFQ